MAETARMAVFHGAGKPFEIREYPVPDPEPGAMLVKVAMANVCGSDLHYWRGRARLREDGPPAAAQHRPRARGPRGQARRGRHHRLGGPPARGGRPRRLPILLPVRALRACLRGRTKSCPVRQSNFLVSCEVWPHFQGGFGQYFYLRPNHAVFKLPDDITDEMAAGVNCALTQVYAGLDLTALRAGQTVVIQGAGGLGVYACAVAREMGAARVIVIDGVEERLALARSSGPTDVVDMREHRTPEDRIKAVKKLTDDWGGDIVMELVGNPKVVDEGLRMTAPEGTYLEIGNINVGWKAEFDPAWIIFGNRRIFGLSHYEAEHLRGALDMMARTRERYPWDRIISHKFPLEAIEEAFVQQDKGHVTRAAIVPN